MRGFERCPDAVEQVARRLDDEQPFSGVFDHVFPAIKAADWGNHVNTCGQMLFNQCPGEASGFLRRTAGAEHNDFVRHRKSTRWNIFADRCYYCLSSASMKITAVKVVYTVI